jgi:hypothetical protein
MPTETLPNAHQHLNSNNLEAFKLLSKAELKKRDHNGCTTLMRAAWLGNLEAVNFLLAKFPRGWLGRLGNSFIDRVANTKSQFVRSLDQDRRIIFRSKVREMCFPDKESDWKTEPRFIWRYDLASYRAANPRMKGKDLAWNALHFAACFGHEKIVAELIKFGLKTKVKNNPYTPMYFAAVSGHSRCVLLLHKAGDTPLVKVSGARAFEFNAFFGAAAGQTFAALPVLKAVGYSSTQALTVSGRAGEEIQMSPVDLAYLTYALFGDATEEGLKSVYQAFGINLTAFASACVMNFLFDKKDGIERVKQFLAYGPNVDFSQVTGAPRQLKELRNLYKLAKSLYCNGAAEKVGKDSSAITSNRSASAEDLPQLKALQSLLAVQSVMPVEVFALILDFAGIAPGEVLRGTVKGAEVTNEIKWPGISYWQGLGGLFASSESHNSADVDHTVSYHVEAGAGFGSGVA